MQDIRTTVHKYIAWAPHMPECALRHGGSINDCDCGLKYLRENADKIIDKAEAA